VIQENLYRVIPDLTYPYFPEPMNGKIVKPKMGQMEGITMGNLVQKVGPYAGKTWESMVSHPTTLRLVKMVFELKMSWKCPNDHNVKKGESGDC